MADRVVKVTLSARVEEYKRGMREAAEATRTVGSEAEKLAQTREALQTLGRTGVVVGGLLAAGVGIAVGKFAEFDQAMSNVLATGEDARENQAALRDAALEAGAATVFSATESANAIEELAKAGLDASDILGGGLRGSLDLAAAGGLGVAQAAEIAATTLQQFRLRGDQASHIADLLAAGAGKAMGDVTDLSGALNQAGLVASQFGLSVEETVGTLSAFASAGMLGSDAGTSMRTMLLRLANPTEEVKELMAELGIEAYNSQGQFIGLAGLAGVLEKSLAGMTDAQRDQTLAMIFGQDAIRGANILLREGEAGIKRWTSAVDDQGYAAETAAQRLDNLIGDWEAFTGALDTAMISMGEGANGPARFLVQSLTELVDVFNGLPAGAQQAVFWAGAIGAAAFTAGGLFLLSVPKIAEYRNAIDQLGPTMQRTSRIVTAAAQGLAIGAIALAAAGALQKLFREIEGTDRKIEQAIAANGNLADSLRKVDEIWADFADPGTMAAAMDGLVRLQENGWSRLSALWDLGVRDAIDLKDGLAELDSGLGDLAQANLPAAQAQFRKWAEATDGSEKQLLALLDSFPTFRDALQQASKASGGLATDEELLALAMGRAAAQTEENEVALAALAGQASDAETDVNELADAIRDFGSAEFDVRAATREFEAAIDDLRDSVEANGASLDVSTAAGRDNEAALDDIAKSALDMAGALYVTTGSQDQAAAAIQRGREELIQALAQFGITGAEAEAYADKLGLIPSNIPTAVGLYGVDAAQQVIDRFIWSNDGRRINLYVDGQVGRQVNGESMIARANGGIEDYQAFASGGFPTGIYAGRPGAIHKFAEPETVWEAYISGKPDQRSRNIGIWQETGRRLGVEGGTSVSIVGAEISGSLDLGDGLVGMIRGQIVAAQEAEARAASRGVVKR